MFLRFTTPALIRSWLDHQALGDNPRTHSNRRSRDRTRARFRLDGLESRRLLSGISAITEFALPLHAGSEPLPITAGPDGNLWFAPYLGGYVGMINPTTHAISEFSAPNGGWNRITAGPDGNIWFVGEGGIGMINPTTHAVAEFPFPGDNIYPYPSGIAAGSDGNLWFAASNTIGQFNLTTHAITQFALPYANATPTAITAGPDGNLWFTEAGWPKGGVASYIGMINPMTHAITEFATPTAYSQPSGIAAGSDGNLWFTEQVAGGAADQIGMINPVTGAIAEFAVPSAYGTEAQEITAGSDGNLWFTAYNQLIGRINPATDAITEYTVPYSDSEPEGITMGPDGNLWYADYYTGKGNVGAIGVATLAPTQLVLTQPPPASVTAGTPFGLTVEDMDSSGNLVSSYNGTVTVGLLNSPAGAALGGTLSVTASGGIATFPELTLDMAASGYTLLVTGNGVGEAVASAISVTPAAATQLAIKVEPGSVTAGSGFTLSTAIEDAYGNVVTSANYAVTVALNGNPGDSTLGGTLSVPASNGVASFGGLTLNKAASGYTLEVSSSGLGGVATSPFPVTPAAASQLVITQQPPATVTVNGTFGLQATIEDAYGNVVTSSSNTVKVALADNPAGAKLGGTLSIKSSLGVAAFSGLTLNKVGSGYKLQVSSSGLSGAITSAIAVTKASSMSSASALAAPSAPDALLAPLAIDSPGFLDTLGQKKRARSI
jgi:streptogramin lyase